MNYLYTHIFSSWFYISINQNIWLFTRTLKYLQNHFFAIVHLCASVKYAPLTISLCANTQFSEDVGIISHQVSLWPNFIVYITETEQAFRVFDAWVFTGRLHRKTASNFTYHRAMPKFLLLRYKFSKLHWFTSQRTQSILNNKIVKEPVTLTSNKCQGIICLTWTGPTLLTFYKSYMYRCVSYFSITHCKTKVNSTKCIF